MSLEALVPISILDAQVLLSFSLWRFFASTMPRVLSGHVFALSMASCCHQVRATLVSLPSLSRRMISSPLERQSNKRSYTARERRMTSVRLTASLCS